MVRLLEGLNTAKFAPRVYVIARSDIGSQAKIEEFEMGQPRDGVPQVPPPVALLRVPRSREVGQSFATSALTTLHALVYSVWHVFRELPSVVLATARRRDMHPDHRRRAAVRCLGIKYITLVYVESIARVETLSLSGKIARRCVDHFLVQWPQLAVQYPGTRFVPATFKLDYRLVPLLTRYGSSFRDFTSTPMGPVFGPSNSCQEMTPSPSMSCERKVCAAGFWEAPVPCANQSTSSSVRLPLLSVSICMKTFGSGLASPRRGRPRCRSAASRRPGCRRPSLVAVAEVGRDHERRLRARARRPIMPSSAAGADLACRCGAQRAQTLRAKRGPSQAHLDEAARPTPCASLRERGGRRERRDAGQEHGEEEEAKHGDLKSHRDRSIAENKI